MCCVVSQSIAKDTYRHQWIYALRAHLFIQLRFVHVSTTAPAQLRNRTCRASLCQKPGSPGVQLQLVGGFGAISGTLFRFFMLNNMVSNVLLWSVRRSCLLACRGSEKLVFWQVAHAKTVLSCRRHFENQETSIFPSRSVFLHMVYRFVFPFSFLFVDFYTNGT